MNPARLFRVSLCAVALTGLTACQTLSVQDGDMFRRTPARPAAALVAELQPLAGERRIETVEFQGEDGEALRGLFIRHPQATATVLYFQGGGNHISKDSRWLLRLNASLPVNLMVWDYRGMGLSGGQGGTAQLLGDARAAAAAARRLSGDTLPLVYWGYSMGTLVSAHLSQHVAPDALILEGTLTTAQDWAENKVPWYAKPFVQIDLAPSIRVFDNRQALRASQRPMLMLVGGRDEVTPPRFTQAVVSQMQHPQCATVVEAPESGHGGIHAEPVTQEALARFVAQVKPGRGC